MWSNSSRCRIISVYLTPMAPGSRFHHISSLFHHISSIFPHTSFRSTIFQSFTFRSINQKYQKYYFTIYPSISYLTLQITVKGLTTLLSHWMQVGVCLCRYSVSCCVVSYWIDTLVLKDFAASPFPLQGKNQRKLKR